MEVSPGARHWVGKLGRLGRLGPDFALMAAACLVLVAVALLGFGTVRTVLGLALAVFFPGYAMSAALLPRRNDLDFLERVALSIGLSLGTVPLLGLVLSYTPMGVRFWPVLLSVLFFSLAMAGLALYRRAKLPPAELMELRFEWRSIPRPTQWGRLTQALALVLAVVVLGSAASLFVVARSTTRAETYTLFYLAADQGQSSAYPLKTAAGQEVLVTLNIENQEGTTVDYWVEVVAGGQRAERIGPLTLEPSQKVEREAGFVLNEVGEKQKVEFRLYAGDESSPPYRYLVLWVDVTE